MLGGCQTSKNAQSTSGPRVGYLNNSGININLNSTGRMNKNQPGGIAAGGAFNLKIKMKNQAQLKNVGNTHNMSSKKASDKKNAKIVRSSTKEDPKYQHGGLIDRSVNLSVPRSNLMITPAYNPVPTNALYIQNSNQKQQDISSAGAIETSQIVGCDINEKMSDMSFQLNINEIIGSIDEKSELQKMKEELNSKDRCIQELLKKIEQLDRTVHHQTDIQYGTTKSRDYTTASSGGQRNHFQDSSMV